MSAYGVIQTLTITNIRIIVQIESRASSRLDSRDTLYFKEKFYLCIFRKETIRHILKKIASFAVGSATQFWTNCKYTGDNVHERLRSAWA